MTKGQQLRAAATIIRGGWEHGALHSEDLSRVCAMGGMCRVLGIDLTEFGEGLAGQKEVMELCEVVVQALQLSTTSYPTSYPWMLSNVVATWNDADDQTQENVAAGLEFAALYWDEQQAGQSHDHQPSGDERQRQEHDSQVADGGVQKA
jgi:hypothetical protein